MGIGNIAEFYQYRRHVGVQVNIEMIGYNTTVRHGQIIHIGLMNHAGQQHILAGLWIIISGSTIDGTVLEGINMDTYKNIRMGIVGNIATCLKFRDGVRIRLIYIYIAVSGKNDFGTGLMKQFSQR